MRINHQYDSARVECNKLFQVVRNTYFPKWINGRHWKLEVLDDDHPEMFGGCYGKCVEKEKIIFLNGRIIQTLDLDKLEVLIIHEITHSVTSDGHAEKFLRRLEKAAKKARTLGKTSIFKQISWEVQRARYRKRLHGLPLEHVG
jgi:hypothetical protein